MCRDRRTLTLFRISTCFPEQLHQGILIYSFTLSQLCVQCRRPVWQMGKLIPKLTKLVCFLQRLGIFVISFKTKCHVVHQLLCSPAWPPSSGLTDKSDSSQPAQQQMSVFSCAYFWHSHCVYLVLFKSFLHFNFEFSQLKAIFTYSGYICI